jgi:preprotein translocase subunit SecF
MSVFTRLFNGQTTYDFIGRRKKWYAISAALIVLSLAGLLIRGLNAGIDFTGGELYEFSPPAGSTATVEDVRETVEDAGVVGDPEVTRVGGAAGTKARFRVEIPSQGTEVSEKLTAAITSEYAAPDVRDTSPKWGDEVTKQALISLVVFLLAVFAYISIRFDWKMALGALAAVTHDLIITAGIYAWVGFEVSPSTVIALLTILGYSLYDTVVVFDKLRENTVGLAAGSRSTYGGAANLAVNQTLMRSINTSLTGLIPVGAILFVGAPLGAETLKDLGLALFVGLLASTYSSIFFAVPIVVDLKEREPQYKALAQRVIARQSRESGGPVPARDARTGRLRTPAAVPAAEPTAVDGDGDPATTVGATSVTRPAPRSQPPRPARPKPKAKGGRPSGKKRR